MKKPPKLMIAMTFLLSLFACNSDNGSSSAQPDIDGVWKTDCKYYENKGIGEVTSTEFSTNRVSIKGHEYADNSCTQLKETKVLSGTTVLKNSLTTPSGMKAHEIDFQFEGEAVWKNLIARQGDTLYLSIGYGGLGRPADVDQGLALSTILLNLLA